MSPDPSVSTPSNPGPAGVRKPLGERSLRRLRERQQAGAGGRSAATLWVRPGPRPQPTLTGLTGPTGPTGLTSLTDPIGLTGAAGPAGLARSARSAHPAELSSEAVPRSSSQLAVGILIWSTAVVVVATLAWLAIDSAGGQLGRPGNAALGQSLVPPSPAGSGTGAPPPQPPSAGTVPIGSQAEAGVGIGGVVGAGVPGGSLAAGRAGVNGGAAQPGAGGAAGTVAAGPTGAPAAPGGPGSTQAAPPGGGQGTSTGAGQGGAGQGGGGQGTTAAGQGTTSAPGATAAATTPTSATASSSAPRSPSSSSVVAPTPTPTPTPRPTPTPSPTPSPPQGTRPVRAIQTTPGGFVMGQCTGSQVTESAAEPADGWSAIPVVTEPGGVRTGLQRAAQRIVVHITCVNGRPAFTVEFLTG